jgi:hypothetical protein
MTFPARFVHFIAGCLLLLPVAQARAQDLVVWERPRNALALPVPGATTVEIYLPQSELYTETGAYLMMGGAVPAAITAILESKDEAAAARLRDNLPAQDFDKLLMEAFSKHLDARHFATITKVVVHHGEPAAIEASNPGAPEEQVLALRFRYYLTPRLASLRVAATARLGARKIVTSAPRKDAPPLFSQELAYEIPGASFFALPSTRAEAWSSMGGPAVAEQIADGVDTVMAMLASEMGTQPRFGRLTGKQIAWGTSYGVVENSTGDRDWIRMRNGWLVSVPVRPKQ